jgi:hypothetical protein
LLKLLFLDRVGADPQPLLIAQRQRFERIAQRIRTAVNEARVSIRGSGYPKRVRAVPFHAHQRLGSTLEGEPKSACQMLVRHLLGDLFPD